MISEASIVRELLQGNAVLKVKLTLLGCGGSGTTGCLGFNPVVGSDVHGAEKDLAEHGHPGVVVERDHGRPRQAEHPNLHCVFFFSKIESHGTSHSRRI